MKSTIRILWMIILPFLMINLINAQSFVGVRGGIGLTKWHYDLPGDVDNTINDDQEYLLTPYVAIPIEVQFSEYFSIQPELIYMQKGTHQKSSMQESGASFEMDARTKINYLELPVLGKARYNTERLEFFVMAGPQVGYALNGKYKVEQTVTNGTTEILKTDEDIDFDEDKIDRFNFSVVFGAGVGVDLGPGKVVADARYDLGLYNMSTNDDSDFKFYDRAFGLSVGYMIPFGL